MFGLFRGFGVKRRFVKRRRRRRRIVCILKLNYCKFFEFVIVIVFCFWFIWFKYFDVDIIDEFFCRVYVGVARFFYYERR